MREQEIIRQMIAGDRYSYFASGGELLARHYNARRDLDDFVALEVPSIASMFQHRLLLRELDKAGMPYVYLPTAILDRQDLSPAKVTVLDQDNRRGLRIGPTTLFTVELDIEGANRWVGSRLVNRSPGRRTGHFLSGFDANERASFFMCELPPSATKGLTTVVDAFEALKPEPVKLAESMGRTVRRQGDVFLIPMPELEWEDFPPNLRGNIRENPFFANTNHRMSEAFRADGEVYARGALTHDPGGRRPDHRPVKLGKVWHLVVKNTVPIST